MNCQYDKYPHKKIPGFAAAAGWNAVCAALQAAGGDTLIAEFYPGVCKQEIAAQLEKLGGTLFDAESCAFSSEQYLARIREFVTDDRVFGVMNTLRLEDVYDQEKLASMRQAVKACKGPKIVYGTGASLVTAEGTLVYFDLPRWEAQCRYKRGGGNWHTDNAAEEYLKKYKQGFFVEWRMADRLKRTLLKTLAFIVDTVDTQNPKMVSGEGFRAGLDLFAKEPFRLMPYFAPEVWGGQWMKEVCDLPRQEKNYAWAFDGVPEENSILMQFGEVCLELPALDLVFYHPRQLLGERVHARFGDEFPIRFDFLDTMGGQNLSLQVHPLTEYIQHTFGMHYTQDESYYILDCSENAEVCLGLKEGISPQAMLRDLHDAQKNGTEFPIDTYVNRWPAKKHDHFLIPAGTVHCSGKNTMVLEISATPYIFTFKLWDWGRLGLDGKPRPVHLAHGEQVIQWDRTTGWVRDNLIDRAETLCTEDGFVEERTGLQEREFIETRRYTLTRKRTFSGNEGVSMCNLVEGESAVITSPEGRFAPYTVHYAETFILPATVETFCIEPLCEKCMVMRATVRG